MKVFALFSLIIVTNTLFAQTDTVQAPKYGWTHGMVAGITLAQIGFTDWSAGGDNALSWTFSIEGKSVGDEEKTNWANAYKFAFGQARISDKGLRKTDDKIDLESILTYKLNQYVNPYAGVTFKSQFAPGYKYDTPVAGERSEVSSFFDPAYLTQSVGAGWQPITEVKTRLGMALRETFSTKHGYADNPETQQIETSKVEGGIESVTDVEWKLAENILLTSKLELFAPLKKIDRVDIRSDTRLTMTVNKFITAVFSLQLLNVEPFPRTQIKEVIALGFTYNVF
ncbi:MAG: DUF3078 domain-containing protein [Bacteroidetes bacterium]|nr:DUF3078 domain-containing protein [Bacteroidota bacterium]MCW5895072.1 DUF3078 domain-containing protein [Bacteroidota bacterium]